MTKFLLLAIPVIMISCTQDVKENEGDPHIISKEIFNVKLGPTLVYGARIKFTSPDEDKALGYQIRLTKNEEVWIDTLFVELSNKDTLMGELVFSEAVVEENDRVDIQTESFVIE